MQAPKWLGECSPYLGQARGGMTTSVTEFYRRYGDTTPSRTELERQPVTVTVPVPDPRTFLPPTVQQEPVVQQETAIPVDATVTTTAEFVPHVYQVTPEGERQVWTYPKPEQQLVARGGPAPVVVEKEELPKWVVPALIAAATMLLGGGG